MIRAYQKMLCRIPSITAAILLFIPFAQAEIYKVVDAQGHVSYTNQAPLSNGDSKAKPIEVQEGYSNKLRVTQTGSVSYCGSIALPTRDVGSTNFYGTVINSERNWKSEVARISAQLAQYQRYSRPESTAYNNNNLTQLAENQCAYDWAQEQRKNAKNERIALDRKSEGLNAYLKEMQQAQISVCGEEPVYSSTDRFFDDKRRAWQHCTSEYQTKMRDIESDLKKSDQQLLDIHKVEQS